MTGDFGVVIVGGGSAGAVLANRLSKDGTRRVLLLEAGEAYRPNLYPADLADAEVLGGPDGHDWSGPACEVLLLEASPDLRSQISEHVASRHPPQEKRTSSVARRTANDL